MQERQGREPAAGVFPIASRVCIRVPDYGGQWAGAFGPAWAIGPSVGLGPGGWPALHGGWVRERLRNDSGFELVRT